jgi:class 3 adenylate cyclase
MAISPSGFVRMIRMIGEIDVRAVLPAIHVRTLVTQRLDDRLHPPFQRRYLASHIVGARYFEHPGDHLVWFGATDALLDEVEDFLTAAPHSGGHDRVLATILIAQTVSTETTGAAEPGRIGRPEADDRLTGHKVQSHRGRAMVSTGEGVLATFDAPGQAIRCTVAIRDAAAAHGIQTRASVHTGELEVIGDGIAGSSVDIALGIPALARPAEILASRTVKDLVVGSAIAFTARGTHELGGVPDRWPLFAVSEREAR